MIELIIVRHGQSVGDIEHRFEGRADLPLTHLGREQADKLANWLSTKYKFDKIVSSPLSRASETAQIIGNKLNLDISLDDRLMEYNKGVIDGLLKEEADKKYPIPEGGRKYYERIEKGESLIDLRARAEEFLAELVGTVKKDNVDKKLLIVSHGNLISQLLKSFLKLPMDSKVHFSTGDTGVHSLKIYNNDRIVITTNMQQHLL